MGRKREVDQQQATSTAFTDLSLRRRITSDLSFSLRMFQFCISFLYTEIRMSLGENGCLRCM